MSSPPTPCSATTSAALANFPPSLRRNALTCSTVACASAAFLSAPSSPAARFQSRKACCIGAADVKRRAGVFSNARLRKRYSGRLNAC
eukprot:433012-Rhodomonas_salina.1